MLFKKQHLLKLIMLI